MSFLAGYDTDLAISRRQISGHSEFHKHGRNTAVGTTATLISTAGGAIPYMPTAAVSVEIVTTGNDTAAGTGARSVTITGLNASWQLTSVTTETNAGTAAVTGTFIRVFSAMVETVGTYGGSNENLITIRQSGAGTTFLQIAASASRALTSHYCVPTGYSLYVKDLHYSVDTGKSVSLYLYERSSADDVTVPYSPTILHTSYEGLVGANPITHTPPVKYAAKTDLWVVGIVPTGTSSVSVAQTGVLIAE